MGVVSIHGSLLLMAFLIHTVLTAPVIEESTALLGPDQLAEGNGCYYNYEHYEEGDRILTNEPCLNCTCHNRMLMCYLRVCPFTKAIGQDCKIEKKPDQCCPVITCPQVHVALLTSSTTETSSAHTAVGHPDNYGCVLDDNTFYADGAQVPSDPKKPCELCYCIRNRTACVMQECTLNVEGCKPVYQEGVCCPVRYDCDYDEVLTTPRPTAGLITTPGGPNECKANEIVYQDGEMINNMTDNPCEHCYCMRGDIVCAVQDCGTPLEHAECTALPAEPGQCCPSTYQCPNGTVPAHALQSKPSEKPIPPQAAISLSQTKPDPEDAKLDEGQDGIGVTEGINKEGEKPDEGVESTSEIPQQVSDKIEDSAFNTMEASEVSSEAPKEEALIEIITTVKPQNLPEVTSQNTNEALQTGVEQATEGPEKPEVVPEQDQVEETLEDHHLEEHETEQTTAPGIYTEISVENVEMNTSPPETSKPSSSEAPVHDKEESVHADDTQGPTTIEPSVVSEEPSKTEIHEAVNEQKIQETTSQADIQETTIQPEKQETSQSESHDATSEVENQVAGSQLDSQGAGSQHESQEGTHLESEGFNSLQEEVTSKAEIQETTTQPQNQEIRGPTENQTPSSQVVSQEASSHQEGISELDNGEVTGTQGITTTPEPSSPIQESQELTPQEPIPQEPITQGPVEQKPIPQEDEKLNANINSIPETTATPVTSTTTTTEAEPEELPRIPGEGSCLHRGITYAPNTEVPSKDPCKRCRCVNSIVRCSELECPEPPISLYSNCVPMPPTDDTCCPTYFCEQKPSQEPEAQNHMSIDKIDEGITDEDEISEGVAATTVASIHEEDIAPSAPENVDPTTHDNPEATNDNAEDSSHQESIIVTHDDEEEKPSEESTPPESHPAQPEPEIPEELQAPVEHGNIVDTTTIPPEASVEHEESSADGHHEESQTLPNEEIPSVSHGTADSESIQDLQAGTTPAPAEPSLDTELSHTNAMEEDLNPEPVSQTTSADNKESQTESPKEPVGGEVSSDVTEGITHQPDLTAPESSSTEPSTAQPPEEPSKSSDTVAQESEPLVHEKPEEPTENIETTVLPVSQEVTEKASHDLEAQLIPEEQQPIGGEAHIDTMVYQEPVTEDGSGSISNNVPITLGLDDQEKEHTEHDSEPSASSQPGEVPTIDEEENDLTGIQKEPESPTTVKQKIPDESTPLGLEDSEGLLPTTEGPSSANQGVSESFVTSGPPVLFPDISHQGAPIHIPGPAGISPGGITAEDERIGDTEKPNQEPTQTEQTQTGEGSLATGEHQASEGIKDEIAYTTEGLNAFSPETEEASNEVISDLGSDKDSSSGGNNQINESSQTSKPETHNENEISPPENETSASGEISQTSSEGESKKPEDAAVITTEQPVTEIPQESVQTHGESEPHHTQDETESHHTQDETEKHDATETHDGTVTHDGMETHDGTETHVGSESHDGTEIHEEMEQHQSPVESTDAKPEEGPEPPVASETDQPEVSSTDAPSVPIVTHGDLPVPSETSTEHTPSEHILLPESALEQGKEPAPEESAQPQSPQPSEDAHESDSHSPTSEVESSGNLEQQQPQAVTEAPDNDEVVTHIDSAGPQQVPEIANQVVETEFNTIEHATGPEGEKHPNLHEEDKISEGNVEADQESPSLEQHAEKVPNEHEELIESVTPAIPQPPQITPEDHSSELIPTQEDKEPIPEVGILPAQEDHSEGHTDEEPTAEEHSEAIHAEEHQPDVTAQEIPLEQALPEQQPTEKILTGEEHSESSTEKQLPENVPSEDAQTQPSEAQEENIEQTTPGSTTHEGGEHIEQEPKPEHTLDEHPVETILPANANQETEQAQTTPALEKEPSPEQQVDEGEETTAHPVHQEGLPYLSGDRNLEEGGTSENIGEHTSTERGPQNEEHVELSSQSTDDSSHAASGTDETQTAAPPVEQTMDSQESTTLAEHSGASEQLDIDEGIHTGETEKGQTESSEPKPEIQDSQEPEKSSFNAGIDSESHPTGLEDLSSLGVTSPAELPAESAPSAPLAPEFAPSAPELVAPEETSAPEGVQPSSDPSAPETTAPGEPLAPESAAPQAPSAPESVAPEVPSAPESTEPEAPSAPESAVPEAPSAPEFTAPEVPSASGAAVPEAPSAPELTVPEEPSAPEAAITEAPSAPESAAAEPSSAPESAAPEASPESTVPEQASASESSIPQQPLVPTIQPISQEQDVPTSPAGGAHPDQSSQLFEEIEKEQPLPGSSSSPISEFSQSSPLPPVEIPSTESPVMPPGLQNWSQKPYHPPEHQQHHTTAPEVPHLPEDTHYPSQPYDQDYEDEDNVSYGPGTCRYGGKVYLSAQQIPRDDPCDFCFCFRSDIICLQQSCPPPIRGCYQETIKGFCCPRYECHVSMATMVNITTTSTTTTTTVPPHFLSHHYNGSATKAGCQVKGIAYRVGDRIPSTSGPCLDCRCGADGQMKCDPTVCGPQESLLRQVMAASVTKRRRR